MQPCLKEYEKTAWFRGNLKIFFRPIQHGDAVLISELFHSHSEQTILYRYFSHLRELSPELMRRFVDLDYQNDMAIVGLVPFRRRERILCVGRYFRNPHANEAEIAITVHDNYQRHGIGTFLLQTLTEIAQEHGLDGLTADVLADNHGMMRLLHKCWPNMETNLEAGVYHVSFLIRGETKQGAVLGH